MDNTLSLEGHINSYKFLAMGLFFLIIGVIVLYAYNPASFNKIFGYEIFITIPILILISALIMNILKLKNNEKTYFSEKLFPNFNQ